MCTRLVFCGTAPFLLVILGMPGCGNASSPISAKNIVGAWYEDPSLLTAGEGFSARPVAETDRRQLAFQQDGTFKLTVCDPSGQPRDPAQFVAGRWHIRGDRIVFTIKTVAVGPDHAGWGPERFVGLRLGDHGGQRDYLEIRGADGVRVRYGRVAPQSAGG